MASGKQNRRRGEEREEGAIWSEYFEKHVERVSNDIYQRRREM